MPALPTTANALQAEMKRPLPPGAVQVEYRHPDVPGLSLIKGKNRQAWSLTFTTRDGKRRRDTLGYFPEIGLATARELAEAKKTAVRAGADPQAEKRAYRSAPTVETTGEEFLAKYAAKKATGEDARILHREVFPVIGSKKLVDVKRSDIHKVLDPITARGSHVMANRTLAALRKMLSWSVERGLIEANPAKGIRRPGKETSRGRVLSDDEIKTLWNALPTIGGQGPLALKLLLLTGQREMEVVGARWSEFDLDAGLWTLPAGEKGRSKARQAEHIVPLSEPVLDVLRWLREMNPAGNSVFVGTKTRDGAKPATRALATMARRRLLESEDDDGNKPEFSAPWTIHDLRRTVRTGLSTLKVQPHVAELVIGHAVRGIVAVYDRYAYLNEKRDALNRWADHVMVAVGEKKAPSNVVPMVRA